MLMINLFELFTLSQGNMLIRLLLAYLLCDFVFQTKKMLENKSWFSNYMILHIAIVYLCTALLTSWWLWSVGIAIAHYIIEGITIEIQKRKISTKLELFIAEQAAHCLLIIIVWAAYFGLWNQLFEAFKIPFTDYQSSLIIMGYLLVSTPIGYIIKLTVQDISITNDHSNIRNRGKQIGIFERIIILTFVLLGQYEAIGFLITGKSIIRFANNEGHLRSEYVLVGTMMSYAMSIIVGVSINWLLKL